MLYRMMQFVRALVAKLNDEDRVFIETYLTKRERILFDQLRVYEQKHCLKVARAIKSYASSLEKEQHIQLIRAGLLHDIGKIKYPLNPIEKSIIVLLNHLTKGRVKKLNYFKMVRCYYDHPQIGVALLEQEGVYEKTFLNLIQYHHTDIELGESLKILKVCDGLS